jgi:LysM repeat protein
LALVAVGLAAFWGLTHKNALQVSLNGKSLGIIKEKNVTAENLKELVSLRLQKENGTEIELLDTITTLLVHSPKSELISSDSVLNAICSMANYRLLAAVIIVDNTEICVVASAAAAADIKNRLIGAYIEPGQNITEKETVEEFVIESRYVGKEEVDTAEAAYDMLNRSFSTTKPYTVKKGDTTSVIADANGMSLAELQELNPGIDVFNGVLSIGQQISLKSTKPFISVRTVETITYTEVEPKQIDYQYNPNELSTFSRVVRQGKDGQSEVTAEIVRVNAFEVERNVINRVITVQPVNEIIEKGTK